MSVGPALWSSVRSLYIHPFSAGYLDLCRFVSTLSKESQVSSSPAMSWISKLFPVQVGCIIPPGSFLGEFFLNRFEGVRTEGVVCCTDCKAPWGKLWFVILGYINKIDLTVLDLFPGSPPSWTCLGYIHREASESDIQTTSTGFFQSEAHAPVGHPSSSAQSLRLRPHTLQIKLILAACISHFILLVFWRWWSMLERRLTCKWRALSLSEKSSTTLALVPTLCWSHSPSYIWLTNEDFDISCWRLQLWQ